MIHVRDYAERVNKRAAREWMFADIPPRTSILTLPSQQLGCVDHMVKTKIIGRQTRQQWVERNRRIAKLLEIRADEHDHVHLHHGQLETYQPIAPVDFANLDMECSFTEKLGLWIEQMLAPKLLPRAYIILTVMTFGRNNEFLETWLPEQITQGLLRDELHRLKIESGCLNDEKAIPAVLLRSALHRFEVRRLRSAGYCDRDTADMLTVSYYVTDWARTPVTPFSQIVADYRAAPIHVDRSHNGTQNTDVFATVVRTLASLNFSMTPHNDDAEKWWIHNHDRVKTTLPVPLTLQEIMQFFQINGPKKG